MLSLSSRTNPIFYNFRRGAMGLYNKAFKTSQRKMKIGKNKEFMSDIYPPIRKQVPKTKAPFPLLSKPVPSMKLLIISCFFIMPVIFCYVIIKNNSCDTITGSLKSERKGTGGGESNLSVCSLCEKIA